MFYRQRTKLHRYFTHRPHPQKPWQRFLNVGFSLLTAALMLMVVVLLRDGKVWGKELHPAPSTAQADTLTTLSDGSLVVNTSELGKDIIGYGGPVPLAITIKDDTVRSITALDNSETPDFFAEVKPLLKLWESRSLSEADTLKVDVVSGATYSSRALIDNVRTGVHFLRDYQDTHSWWAQVDLSPKFWASLLVVLLAAILPLWVHNRTYRRVQQLLNVCVLGLWTGTFLNYAALLNYTANGINPIVLLVPTIMLVTAFVYPLFGKKSYYCSNICPFGAAQDLMGILTQRKKVIPRRAIKALNLFRQLLWAALMLCMWTGLWFTWVEYEAFSAFIFESASPIVIGIAFVFVLLSLAIPRPYCRFVCPTGTLFKIAQKG